jgi:predicted ArsR family transcriptional regulator
MADGTVQLTDPRALRAVAHPTRLKLIGLLRRLGPLTATQAGERIGESPAGCSFHLRQLAKWGLVEEAGGGRGRERPWRATAQTTEWPGKGAGEEVEEASDALTRVVLGRYFEEAMDWLARRAGEPREWADAPLGDRILYATAEELAEIDRRIEEILAPYVRRVTAPETRPEGAREAVWIQLGFPLEPEAGAAADAPEAD